MRRHSVSCFDIFFIYWFQRVSILPVILCALVFTFDVYIRLYLINILSLPTFCINITQHFTKCDDLLLRLKVQIVFQKESYKIMDQYKLNVKYCT
jgi:hypothetical protein